jgi:RNA polymerase sigma-70 factor (ECF subfamily)
MSANIAVVDEASDAPTPADADAALVRRTAAGEHDALRELYARYGALVHALVLRLLGDRHLAEEVVEDVFFAVWRQARRYDPQRGRVASWLITLARNRATEHVHPDIGLVVEAEQVARAFVELPEPQFEVLRLAYFERLGAAVIAQRLGLQPSDVEGRLRLALDGLRAIARRPELGARR